MQAVDWTHQAPAGFDHVFALNVSSPLYATTTAVRHMIDKGKGGAILNIVSIDGLFPAPTEALYGAAKAAMVNLTQCLAYELGRHRIRANAIAPGVIETQLTAEWLKTPEQNRSGVCFGCRQHRRRVREDCGDCATPP